MLLQFSKECLTTYTGSVLVFQSNTVRPATVVIPHISNSLHRLKVTYVSYGPRSLLTRFPDGLYFNSHTHIAGFDIAYPMQDARAFGGTVQIDHGNYQRFL